VSLGGGWVAVLLAAAALAALAGLAARLGPTSVSAPQAGWLLPLPVGRRSLLRTAALRWPALAAVLGAPCGAALALALGAEVSAAVLLAAVGLGAAAAGGLVLLVALVQPDARAHRLTRLVFDAALAAVPAAGLVLAVTGAPTHSPTGTLVPVAAAAALLAAVLALVVERRSAQVPDAALRARGAVGGEALVAVLSLDVRALGRALAEESDRARRKRSWAFAWLARVPLHLRGPLALVTSDAVLVLRTPRHLGQIVAAACLPVLALTLQGPPRWTVALTALASAFAAGSAAAEGSRRAQYNPVLDGLLPLGETQVRRARLVVPFVGVAGWALVAFAAVAWRYGGGAPWLLLGLLAAPAWAAGAVRAAYRTMPNFTLPMVASPMGALPTGTVGLILKGPDVALGFTLPVLLALVNRSVAPQLLILQAGLSWAAVAIVGRAPRLKPPAGPGVAASPPTDG